MNRKIIIFWFLMIIPLFVVANPLVALAAAAILLALLSPRTPIEKVCFYIGTFAAMSADVNYYMPFPGINYLIIIDYAKISFLILLLPLLFRKAQQFSRLERSMSIALVLFALTAAALSFRDLPFTSALRAAVDQCILVLPAIAIAATIRNAEDFQRIRNVLVTFATIFAAISAVSQLVRWNFYADGGMADVRSGILRIGVTTVPALAGFIGFVGMMASTQVFKNKPIAWYRVWSLRMGFVLLAVFSYSRGAWVAAIVGMGIYRLMLSKVSNAAVALIAIAGAVAGFIGGTTTLLDYDPYGTFSYRVALLRAAKVQFMDAPLFGSPNFLQSGHFDHLWTGMGIIDVVNTYVQVTMLYGAIGMALFALPFVFFFRRSMQLRNPSVARSDEAQRKKNELIAFSWSLMTAYLTLILTISSVSYILNFGYLLLGICVGLAARGTESVAEAVPVMAMHKEYGRRLAGRGPQVPRTLR
ncbi:MAG: O-antigen ligase family protein [Hyphomicrobiales bacterium]